MDRVSLRLASRLALVALSVLFAGPGCSRLKTYRAQNAPLPGFSLLGRSGRAKAATPPVALGRQAGNPGDVAWTGPVQNGRPPKRIVPRNAPSLAAVPGPVVVSAPTSPAQGSATPATVPNDPAAVPNDPAAMVQTLIATGRESLGRIQTYQVSMTRQERVGESLLPSESLNLSVRRAPKAVRLEWAEGSHKGREVLYSSTEHGGLIHINMADSVLPIPRMSLQPDSPMVMRNSRHPITEAGLDAILDKMESSLGEQVAYEGIVTPDEVGSACHKVTRKTATGDSWLIYLDAKSALPCFVQATGPGGDLLERYSFRDLVPNPPALADASAFNPDARWGPAKGLFGRMAQARNPGSETK